MLPLQGLATVPLNKLAELDPMLERCAKYSCSEYKLKTVLESLVCCYNRQIKELDICECL